MKIAVDKQMSSFKPSRERPPNSKPRVFARGAFVVLASLSLVTLTTSSASASSEAQWGPVASYYKDQVRVEGSGRAYVGGGNSNVTAEVVLTDPNDDGNNVYAHVTFEFFNTACFTGEPQWCSMGRFHSTGEIGNATQTFNISQPLDRNSDRVRVVVQVCAQMGWPVPDNCSDYSIVTLNY